MVPLLFSPPVLGPLVRSEKKIRGPCAQAVLPEKTIPRIRGKKDFPSFFIDGNSPFAWSDRRGQFHSFLGGVWQDAPSTFRGAHEAVRPVKPSAHLSALSRRE